mmetsp:Transcript_3647/g.4493  ORF Transcript_3647/g.4493 Transcript_3647/m.4493 type:complete len:205 (+) Transcript_3647:978-1592(+)
MRVCRLASVAVATAFFCGRALMSTFTDWACPTILWTFASKEVHVQTLRLLLVRLESAPRCRTKAKIMMTSMLRVLHNDDLDGPTFRVCRDCFPMIYAIAQEARKVLWFLHRVVFCMSIANAILGCDCVGKWVISPSCVPNKGPCRRTVRLAVLWSSLRALSFSTFGPVHVCMARNKIQERSKCGQRQQIHVYMQLHLVQCPESK